MQLSAEYLTISLLAAVSAGAAACGQVTPQWTQSKVQSNFEDGPLAPNHSSYRCVTETGDAGILTIAPNAQVLFESTRGSRVTFALNEEKSYVVESPPRLFFPNQIRLVLFVNSPTGPGSELPGLSLTHFIKLVFSKHRLQKISFYPFIPPGSGAVPLVTYDCDMKKSPRYESRAMAEAVGIEHHVD